MRSRAWISCRKIEQVLASGIIAPFLRVACELARPLTIDASAAVGVAIGRYCCGPGHFRDANTSLKR